MFHPISLAWVCSPPISAGNLDTDILKQFTNPIVTNHLVSFHNGVRHTRIKPDTIITEVRLAKHGIRGLNGHDSVIYFCVTFPLFIFSLVSHCSYIRLRNYIPSTTVNSITPKTVRIQFTSLFAFHMEPIFQSCCYDCKEKIICYALMLSAFSAH